MCGNATIRLKPSFIRGFISEPTKTEAKEINLHGAQSA